MIDFKRGDRVQVSNIKGDYLHIQGWLPNDCAVVLEDCLNGWITVKRDRDGYSNGYFKKDFKHIGPFTVLEDGTVGEAP